MSNSLFIRTLNGEKSLPPPIWFMRQAGRYLPEYRQIRKSAGSFLDLCYNPELASEVTLQPIRRYDLDAAILFADILLLPDALGQTVKFVAGEGPHLSPLVEPHHLSAFEKADIDDVLGPVYETVRRVRAELPRRKALIGFAGAPWTVATYMLAGGPLKDPSVLRQCYYEDPDFIMALIELLTARTIDYLRRQCEAGADAVQLFDTWAGGLPPPVLDVVSVQPLLSIARALRESHPATPVILFPKGVGEKLADYTVSRDVAALGIDHTVDPAWVRAAIAQRMVIQGGLDPLVTIEGGERMKQAANVLLRLFHDTPYVFNLGHGFTPETSPEAVDELVRYVREWRADA